MTASALRRRAWRELSRRRARSAFTILTIAAAVTALSMFAVPILANRAMADRVAEHRLDDVQLHTGAVVLSDAQIEELRAIPNVAGLELRAGVGSTLGFGDQRTAVAVIGVRDFDAQEVNVVTVERGAAPGSGEVLVDTQNLRSGRLGARTGDRVALISPTGARASFTVSGEGGSLRFSDPVRDNDPVVYIPHQTLAEITGFAGYYQLELRVADRSDGAVTATIEAVRSSLESMVPGLELQTVPRIRAAGDWPGRESMENVTTVFYVLAALAAASALFMVYNTMNSIVREQTAEIAVMKAVGGRRRQIAGSFVRTAVIMGSLGTVAGIALGFLLSNGLLQLASANLMTLTPGWGLSGLVVALSLVVGVGGSALASLPAVYRAVRLPVTEALRDPGIAAGYGQGRLDRALQRSRFLPRIAQLGLRNTARRKGATLATAIQVGFAVGIALGLLILGGTVMTAAENWRVAAGGDIEVADGPGQPDFEDRIAGVRGVAVVEGVYWSTVDVAGRRAGMLGLPAETELFAIDLAEGRWFTAAEEKRLERVAVIGLPLAATTGLAVGDVVPAETPSRLETFEIIGVDRNMENDGKIVYLPLETHFDVDLRTLPNWYWVRTESADEAFIDRVAADIGDNLAVAGYPHAMEIAYVESRAARAEERLILGIIGMLGVPIALIGMIGLTSAMTISVLERTREIGILRSIGARARDVRRLIRAEAVAIAALGWVLALPLGLGAGWAMLWVIGRAFHASFGLVVPYWAALPALAGSLLLAALVARRPARRAIRLSPGAALRYE